MRSLIWIILGVSLAWLGMPGRATTTVVTNSAELSNAISESDGGVVELAPGEYDDLTIANVHPSVRLVVRSADPARPAVVRGWVMIQDSSNIRLEALTVDPRSIADFDGWHPALLIIRSDDVEIADVLLDGHVVTDAEGVASGDIEPDDPDPGPIAGFATGSGLAVRYSTGVRLEDMEIRRFARAGFLQNSVELDLARLWIHEIRSDGLSLEDLSDITIADSRFEDFFPWRGNDVVWDHPDMIEFWGANGDWGIQDLTISGNAFLQGEGGWTQTIFGRIGSGDPALVRFERFQIFDNLIVNSHLHGISLGDVQDSEIHHNLLVPASGYAEANSTAGLPTLRLFQDVRPSSNNEVYSNVLVVGGAVATPSQYYGDAFDLNSIGTDTFVSVDPTSDAYFRDVFPNLYGEYASLPDLRQPYDRPNAIPEGYGPRWIDFTETARFFDIERSIFADDILWMDEVGITKGCSAYFYCPDDPVTRDQMAAFFVRALDLPPGADAGFLDLANSVLESDVNALAAAGITNGCEVNRFCPREPVTRAQMAAFFVRALNLSSAPDAGFIDAAGVFEDEINRLAAVGVTLGCSEGLFCPDDHVTRGQMAAFFHRASQLDQWPG